MRVKQISLLIALIGLFGIFFSLKKLKTKFNETFHNRRNDEGIFSEQPKDFLSSPQSTNPSFQPLPLLTMFTTFKEDAPHHRLAHRLVILNWASFGRAYVKPVLFTNLSMDYLHKAVQGANAKASLHENRTLAEHALLNGWDVLPIPSVNPYGTPHLKAMLKDIFKNYNSTFYGFANGDLLFDNSLVENLQFLKKHVQNPLSNNAMLLGRRTEVFMYKDVLSSPTTSPVSVLTENSIFVASKNKSSTTTTTIVPIQAASNSVMAPDINEEFIQRFEKSNLKKISAEGNLAGIFAIDYFFFTKENCSFNWSAISNVVIGRVAYDQYLVAMALNFSTNAVDLTRTMLAVHLSKPNVPETGRFNIDKNYNLEVIGTNFPYNQGLTSTTQYFLQYGSNFNLQLVNRKTKIVYL